MAAALLEKLELDDLLNRAFHQLGLTQDHFEEREYDDFRDDGATEEIVALRRRGHMWRRFASGAGRAGRPRRRPHLGILSPASSLSPRLDLT